MNVLARWVVLVTCQALSVQPTLLHLVASVFWWTLGWLGTWAAPPEANTFSLLKIMGFPASSERLDYCWSEYNPFGLVAPFSTRSWCPLFCYVDTFYLLFLNSDMLLCALTITESIVLVRLYGCVCNISVQSPSRLLRASICLSIYTQQRLRSCFC